MPHRDANTDTRSDESLTATSAVPQDAPSIARPLDSAVLTVVRALAKQAVAEAWAPSRAASSIQSKGTNDVA